MEPIHIIIFAIALVTIITILSIVCFSVQVGLYLPSDTLQEIDESITKALNEQDGKKVDKLVSKHHKRWDTSSIKLSTDDDYTDPDSPYKNN